MKRVLILAALMTLALAALASAQSGSANGSASGQATGAIEAKKGEASASAGATAEASASAEASFEKMKQDIEAKGAKVSAEARAKAEAKLEATAKRVDEDATRGEQTVAGRLAKEFGMTVQALLDEKSQLDLSWGQLMIAHTLEANAKADVTVQQLVEMHGDGMGWGQIAAGLGLKLGDAVSAVNSEGRVAAGEVRADGRVAVIHGEGARAGLGVGAGAGLGLQGGGKGVGGGVGGGLGADIKVKVGH
ncbi:MAG: hypothetical protein HZC42_09435 [Candidatus Eisenbacteria bacterium]|nr:hypothetical protein [Candidatus Eisenbacteria bacterium]